MHPTNNRSSPEWFPCPRSSSKIIDRRRGFDKIIQIHRRHGFGEIIQKIKILSATWFRRKYWGRFWCSWTNRKWPKLIPDCNNSAVNWNFTWNDVEVLGLSLFPFLKVSRYVDPASRINITECHSRLRWLQNYDIPCSPLQTYNHSKLRSFTSVQMSHTHIHTHTYIYMYIWCQILRGWIFLCQSFWANDFHFLHFPNAGARAPRIHWIGSWAAMASPWLLVFGSRWQWT